MEKIAIRAPKALRERIGEELKPYLSSLSDESMPPTFINKLRNDISAVANMDVFFSSLAWLPPVEIEKVLGGKRLITSTQVIELAQAMGKPIDDYLIAAGYIPEHLQNLVNDKRTAGVLNSLSKKKPEVINKVLSIIETVLGMDMEKKR